MTTVDVRASGQFYVCLMLTALQELQSEFCPRLDAGLVAAIALDFDLEEEHGAQQARFTLSSLTESAEDEENSGFDPSGSSGVHGKDKVVENGSSELAESAPEVASRSQETDATDVTPAFSLIDLGSPEGSGSEFFDSQNGDPASELENLSQEEKGARLREMFTTLTTYTVNNTLKKSNGSFYQAMDMLLTVVHFEEEDAKSADGSKLAPKGVDGFTGKENGRRGRKSKGRNARRLLAEEKRSNSTSGSWDLDSSSGSENRWNSFAKDIEFVSSRTIIPHKKVTSVYHNHNTSLSMTIYALVAAEMATPTPTTLPEAVIQTQTAELSHSFPTFSAPEIAAVLRLTGNAPSAAQELAEIMAQNPIYTPKVLNTMILPQHSPVDFRSEDESESYSFRPSTNDANVLHAQANSYGYSGAILYAQAGAAYQRGKSQPLMGGAAAYYAEEGRKKMNAAKDMSAAAADARVEAQSTSRQLDLHYVSVHHAVRIAKAKVNQWYEGLGDRKYAPGGGGPLRDGYVIVTGKGSHSRPGAPRIGHAVLRQLTAAGWKVEAGDGHLRVTGKRR
jgi:hypothetical protein